MVLIWLYNTNIWVLIFDKWCWFGYTSVACWYWFLISGTDLIIYQLQLGIEFERMLLVWEKGLRFGRNLLIWKNIHWLGRNRTVVFAEGTLIIMSNFLILHLRFCFLFFLCFFYKWPFGAFHFLSEIFSRQWVILSGKHYFASIDDIFADLQLSKYVRLLI